MTINRRALSEAITKRTRFTAGAPEAIPATITFNNDDGVELTWTGHVLMNSPYRAIWFMSDNKDVHEIYYHQVRMFTFLESNEYFVIAS